MVSFKVVKRLLVSFRAVKEVAKEILGRRIGSLIPYKWSSKKSGHDN